MPSIFAVGDEVEEDQIPQNDFQALAGDRLLEQYGSSTKLKALIALVISEATVLQDAAWTLLDGYDVETATGTALDVLGRIVGLPRPLIDADLFGYFGYIGAPDDEESYGDSTMPEVGGIYSSSFNPTAGAVLMDDDLYRLHIGAKIIRNRASSTAEDALEIVNLVIDNPGSSTTVDQTGTANGTLSIGRALSSVEKRLFLETDLNGNGDQLIPRGAGVDLDYEDTVGPF